ncbi:hypothetical protein NYR60_03050 [Actinobacillus genomosp. 2]|uniref:gp53-like domain-containing protein n=1 Tax=Actinobacillus genomosp. 2 TaxID=230709 RepID=UPI0024437389|nr:hypothetical protein [Actinobacillus genomosp. 2]WGE32603.1 hypothetical protein NYR60_03050 [Actinobacillus genomosp. 2]
MRQKMNPIATDNGRFKDGNPATGEYGTVVTAEHMNNVQDAVRTNQGEILTVLKEAGIEPNETDETQLWQALQVISGQVESIDALRQFEPVRDRQIAYVKGYYAGTNIGGGEFYADFTDKTTADNGGTVIVTEEGLRWKRIYQQITPFDFGAKSEGHNDEQAFSLLESAIISNEVVDLCGKTFVIDVKKEKYKYSNGYFYFKGLNGLSTYEAPYGLLKTGNGIVRINGGEKFGNDYKKEIDPFNLPETVVAIGGGALSNCTGAGQTIAIGSNALNRAKKSYTNIAIGESTLEYLQSSGSVYGTGGGGSRNVAIGGNALQFLEDGVRNIAIGRNTGCGVSKAWDSVLIGASAMGGVNVNGWHPNVESQLGNKQVDAKVVAIGASALHHFNGNFAVAIGHQSGQNLKVGNANTLVGYRTGSNLESEVGWDGYQRTIYGGNDGQKVNYHKHGNHITVTIEGHQCVVGGSANIRWDTGPAFPQPAHWHAWRQEVLSVTNNTVTFYCPYNGDGEGTATIFWSLSKELNNNISQHNTIIGHLAAYDVGMAKESTIVGSMSVQAKANLSNSVILGARNLTKATEVNHSIVIGHGIEQEASDYNYKLDIGNTITGDLLKQRVGINLKNNPPLAPLHIRNKIDNGNGRTNEVDGLLVESSASATVHIDGKNTANLDFVNVGVVKGGLRYSFSGELLTMLVGGVASWRFNEDHVMYPDVDLRNRIGSATRRLKEVFVETPTKEDDSDKVATTKWVKSLFSQKLTTNNGWSINANGEIEQWGTIEMPQGSNTVTINFPIAFNECFFVIPIDMSNTGDVVGMSVASKSTTKAVIQGTKYAGTIQWFAKGR